MQQQWMEMVNHVVEWGKGFLGPRVSRVRKKRLNSPAAASVSTRFKHAIKKKFKAKHKVSQTQPKITQVKIQFSYNNMALRPSKIKSRQYWRDFILHRSEGGMPQLQDIIQI
ncbi:hypothetical protein NST83_12710 [Paenibacillus sp. FSL R10-2782]|uniref:hypothetical protein n=1 Tax=Paenibacillus sp. FSL R10-2782 TaxID=2954661 RepID=UPI0031589F1A